MQDMNTDFMCLGGCNLDLLDPQVLAGAPADSRLAPDNLSYCVGHDCIKPEAKL